MIAPRKMIRTSQRSEPPSAPNRLNRRSRKMIRRTSKPSKNQLADIQRELSIKWRSTLKKLGRFAGKDIGVVVTDSNREKAAYIAKFGREPENAWDAARELTKGQSKKGREKGLTMWQVLALAGDQSLPAKTRAKYAHIFREYAKEFKGKHQLGWSKGLKDILGIEDIKDDQIVKRAESDPISSLFVELSFKQWSVVLKNDVRAEFKHVCGTRDIDAVYKFLIGLPGMKGLITVDLTDYDREVSRPSTISFFAKDSTEPIEKVIPPSEGDPDRSADND